MASNLDREPPLAMKERGFHRHSLNRRTNKSNLSANEYFGADHVFRASKLLACKPIWWSCNGNAGAVVFATVLDTSKEYLVCHKMRKKLMKVIIKP